jgi:Flp pilus assembly pilin Flp
MMYLALLQTVDDDDGITINEGTVIWVLLVVLLVCLIVYVVNRIR